jgi:hypothetical protein
VSDSENSEQQQAQDRRPFKDISPTTAALHFLWRTVERFAGWFIFLTIISYLNHWLFDWDLLSFSFRAIIATVGLLIMLVVERVRRSTPPNN